MKTKLIRAISPYNAELIDSELVNEKNGRSYLRFKDNAGADHKVFCSEDVRPLLIEEKRLLRPISTQYYIMAGDNFLNIKEQHFEIQGNLTKDLAKEAAEWGAIEALVRATKERSLLEGLGWIKWVIILLVIGGIAYFLMNNLGGVFGGIGI